MTALEIATQYAGRWLHMSHTLTDDDGYVWEFLSDGEILPHDSVNQMALEHGFFAVKEADGWVSNAPASSFDPERHLPNLAP